VAGDLTVSGKFRVFPVVVKLNDEVIGGIGAAGAPGGNLDDDFAKGGLEKIRDRLK
jgi:uncharacterized protein GlcG (DUF336 family)